MPAGGGATDFLRTTCKRPWPAATAAEEEQQEGSRKKPSKVRYPRPAHASPPTTFQFTRNFAVSKLAAEVLREFRIIANSAACRSADDVHGPLHIPNGLFNWSWALFHERRQMQGTIWLNVLEREIPAECLEALKLQQDLRELEKYLAPLLGSFLDAAEPPTAAELDERVLQPIRDASNFLSVGACVEANMVANRATVEGIVAAIMKQNVKRDSAQVHQRAQLEERLVDNDVVSPIELRRQLGFYRDITNQAFERAAAAEGHFESQIRRCLHETETEKYCSRGAFNMYNHQIDEFKSEINSFSRMYDIAYEDVDNKINYKKISMDKLRDQRAFLNKEIKRFHFEIARVLREEQEERDAEERRKQEELDALAAEAEELARLARKKKKPDKKKKY